MSWSLPFEDPIPHPDGGTIRTLRQAGQYIMALSKREAGTDHWQAAAEAVIMAAEDRGPLLHARIGMMRALNHGKPAPARERKRAKAYRILK